VIRNKIYYAAKPFVPLAVRRAIRRKFASRMVERVKDVWPIMPASERVPDGWPGWPDGKKFALVLTHDVEGQTGLDKSRDLMRLELELGFHSSFNFIPEGGYSVPKDLREELVRNGFEVGVHDLKHDGRLYRSKRGFKQRAARINRYLSEWDASGFRSGFMLSKLDWLHELEIGYDASTFDTDPFEPQPEGCQTIFPFWVPAPAARAPRGGEIRDSRFEIRNSAGPTIHDLRKGYVELPYTLPQDFTLFLLLREESSEIWCRKLDWIAEHGGMALVDTHPDYMAVNGSVQKNREYPIRLYREFLEYIRSRYSGEYWPALPKEVAAHVLQRSAASGSEEPVKSNGQHPTFGNRWRLRGKRAAVLLYSYYPADPRPRRAAEALAKEGVSVDVICLRETENEPARETINGVRVLRVRGRRYRGNKRRYIDQYTAFILTCFAYLTARSLRRKYDFVHVHNMPDVLVFGALVPKLLGAKVILDLHDPMPELMRTIFQLPEESLSVRLLKRLEKWSLAFADRVFTVNLACKKIYSSRSCPPEKIDVIMNSPDDEIFQFRPTGSNGSNGNGSDPARPFVILYHGSLVRRNGFDLAVDALETVRKRIPAAKLAVCGERTPFFEQVMESARQRQLHEGIQYLGPRNVHQIVEAIDSCDVGIIPNHRNIFTELNTPTRIFEYLAVGKPVIAPQAGGIQDYFGDQDLVFFELGDAGDLAKKIEFTYSHPREVEQIVKRGQAVYLAHKWSQEKRSLLDSISELL
jgi:glycosyltransferase involved in cell wall biosynthesis